MCASRANQDPALRRGDRAPARWVVLPRPNKIAGCSSFNLSHPMNLRPALLTLAFAPLLVLSAPAAESGFTDLFNGKDLSGWEGMPGFWSVRDGAITGQTTAERTLKANTFL